MKPMNLELTLYFGLVKRREKLLTMNFLILIMWLVTTPVKIVSGQSQGTPPKRNENHAQDSKKPEPKTSTSNTVIVVQQEAPDKQNSGTKNAPQSYFARLIAPENLPNIVLCIVGVGGIIVAICTLASLRKQTKAAKDAADAALLNAKAIINAERAWVLANVSPDLLNPQTTATQTSVAINLSYKIIGRTPCWIANKSVWFRIVSEIPDPPDFTNPTKTFEETQVHSAGDNPNEPMTLTCTGTHNFTVEVEHNIPIIYGFICYRDSFGEKRETRFGYRVKIDGHLVRIPLTNYNRND